MLSGAFHNISSSSCIPLKGSSVCMTAHTEAIWFRAETPRCRMLVLRCTLRISGTAYRSASKAAKADPASPAKGITVLKWVRSITSRTREFAPANVKRPPAFLVIVV